MGAAPSTPRFGAAGAPPSPGAAEQMFAALVGGKAYPISSEFWNQLLELPLTLQWPRDRVLQACHAFAQNNYQTKHLAKILIHLVWCLQECTSTTSVSSVVYRRAINAAYISSIFLKFIIENAKADNWLELCLDIDKNEKGMENFPAESTVEYFLMRGVLNYIGSVDVSLESCYLHHELLNLMLVLMSTQLCSGPSPEPKDVHPFIDAAMLQDSYIIVSVVRKLLLNFVARPKFPPNGSHPVFSDDGRPGVLQRVGSAAGNMDPFLQLTCLYKNLSYSNSLRCMSCHCLSSVSPSKFSLKMFGIYQLSYIFILITTISIVIPFMLSNLSF